MVAKVGDFGPASLREIKDCAGWVNPGPAKSARLNDKEYRS